MTWFLDREFLAGLDLRAYNAATIAVRLGLPVETVRAFVDPTRKYRVESNPEYGWLAGASGSHDPALVFVGSPRLSGDRQRPLNAVVFNHRTGTAATHAIDLEDELTWENVLGAAEREIGFMHIGDAPVFSFKHPELWHYAVVPFPFDLHDTVTGTDTENLAVARDWVERGNYVLHCGNSYHMGPDGCVESS
jgi:hypothetical protein